MSDRISGRLDAFFCGILTTAAIAVSMYGYHRESFNVAAQGIVQPGERQKSFHFKEYGIFEFDGATYDFVRREVRVTAATLPFSDFNKDVLNQIAEGSLKALNEHIGREKRDNLPTWVIGTKNLLKGFIQEHKPTEPHFEGGA